MLGRGENSEPRHSVGRKIWGLLTDSGSLAWESAVSAVCMVWWAWGDLAREGSWKRKPSRNFTLFPRTPYSSLEFQTTLIFCKEVSGLCKHRSQMQPSISSAPGLPPVWLIGKERPLSYGDVT